MESGYKILWTDHALTELSETFEYLDNNFTEKELQALSSEIDRTLRLIGSQPSLFQFSESAHVRKVVIKKYNTMYYRERQHTIEILSFFPNRRNPKKRKY